MSIDIETIATFLESHSLKYQIRPSDSGDFIHTGFATQRYENQEGDKHLHLYIVLEENGEFFRVVSPNCYVVPSEETQRALFKTLLMIASKSKMVQFSCENPSQMDFGNALPDDVSLPVDMEWITATVEMPIEDGTLTETQTLRSVFALVKILEYYHPVIMNAIDLGEIDFSIVEQSEFIVDLMNQLLDIEDEVEEESSDEDRDGIDEEDEVLSVEGTHSDSESGDDQEEESSSDDFI